MLRHLWHWTFRGCIRLLLYHYWLQFVSRHRRSAFELTLVIRHKIRVESKVVFRLRVHPRWHHGLLLQLDNLRVLCFLCLYGNNRNLKRCCSFQIIKHHFNLVAHKTTRLSWGKHFFILVGQELMFFVLFIIEWTYYLPNFEPYSTNFNYIVSLKPISRKIILRHFMWRYRKP